MYKLTYKKRCWIVKKYFEGFSTNVIARSQNISRMTVSKLVREFRESGWDGLKDHKTGRPETILNPKIQDEIIKIRKEFGYGACHIEEILKRKGFSISHRQIEKIIIRTGLVTPNIKKQKPRKWVRYELPNPNDLWHTDWSYDPFTGRNLSVYIDDRTRMIVSFGIYSRATAETSISLLNTGISDYGKPKAVMTDHGSQYYANHPNADQNNTLFRSTLNILGIKHYLARVNRPQTNGKVERFFRTYKDEYARGSFDNIGQFIQYYNEVRLHMSLNYKTPKEIWDSYHM